MSKNISYQIQKLLMKHYFSVCRSWFPSLSRAQRPRKHLESEGALAKRGTFVYDKNQTILCRSQAERKFLKIWNLYNVGNGLYYCKKDTFFPAKEGVQSGKENAPKRALFSLLKKVGGGGRCPHCLPGSAAHARALRDI